MEALCITRLRRSTEGGGVSDSAEVSPQTVGAITSRGKRHQHKGQGRVSLSEPHYFFCPRKRTASVGTKPNILPDTFPFLTPCKGALTMRTDFLRQIRFAAHFWHGSDHLRFCVSHRRALSASRLPSRPTEPRPSRSARHPARAVRRSGSCLHRHLRWCRWQRPCRSCARHPSPPHR